MGGHYGEKDEDYSDVVSVAKVEGFLTKIFNSFDEEGRIALETALNDENFEGKNVLSHNNVIARVLAVVGLHPDAFKPFSLAKTSVLFLQKTNRYLHSL